MGLDTTKLIKKSRKSYTCDICKHTIEKGVSYHKSTGVVDAQFYTTNICIHCKPILDHYFHLHKDEEFYDPDEVAEDVKETIKYDCPTFKTHNSCDDCPPNACRNCIDCEYGATQYLKYEHEENLKQCKQIEQYK